MPAFYSGRQLDVARWSPTARFESGPGYVVPQRHIGSSAFVRSSLPAVAPRKVVDDAAKMVGVSPRTMESIIAVQKAAPELIPQISGARTVLTDP